MIIHTFDDLTNDIEFLINKRQGVSKVIGVDYEHVHSYGTDDFNGWTKIPDVIYVDGHMPGGWEKIFDWLYEHKELVTQPLLVIPNSSDSWLMQDMYARLGMLRDVGCNVFRSVESYQAATGVELLLERPTLYEYPACMMLLEYAQQHIANGFGSTAPITQSLYFAVVAECFKDQLLNERIRLVSKTISPGSMQIYVNSPVFQFVVASAGKDLLCHPSGEHSQPHDAYPDGQEFAATFNNSPDFFDLGIKGLVEDHELNNARNIRLAGFHAFYAGPSTLMKYINTLQRLIGFDDDIAICVQVNNSGMRNTTIGPCAIYATGDEVTREKYDRFWPTISKHIQFSLGHSSFFYRPCVDLMLVDEAEFKQKQSSEDCVIISKRRF
jgi:hypothetical protein